MNIIAFTGNIGKDCETRYTQAGDPVTSFSAALTSGYGEKKVTTWLNCSLFGKRGESLAPYLKKGAQVAITGEFAARQYQSKDGAEKMSLDVRVNDVTLIGGKQDATPQRQAEKPNEPAGSFDDFSDTPF